MKRARPDRFLRLPLRHQHRRHGGCARRWPSTSAKLPGVAVSRDYKYMCSDPGQELIQQDIQEHKLNRIVVASCSPLLHEHTFRNATEAGGLNPFFFQMVNIREHDSWVHTDRAEATAKAKALVARRDPARAATTSRSRSRRSRSIPTCWSWAAASPASTRR